MKRVLVLSFLGFAVSSIAAGQICPPAPPSPLFDVPGAAVVDLDKALDLRIEDFDGDGDQDLVYFGYDTTVGGLEDTFRFLRNDIDLCPAGDTACYFKVANDDWLDRDLLQTPGKSHFAKIYEMVFVDVDHDGDRDLILGASPGEDLIFEKDQGKLLPPRSLDGTCTLGSCPDLLTTGMYSADVDGDGDYDVVAVYRELPGQIFFNDGTGFFPVVKSFQIPDGEVGLPNAGGGNRDVQLADFDHDGDLDAAVARMQFPGLDPPNLGVLIYRNEGLDCECDDRLGGQTPFCFWYELKDENGQSPSAPGSTFVLTTADVDRDGDYDVLQPLSNAPAGLSKRTRIYLNDGTGQLGGASHEPSGVIGDADDDFNGFPALGNPRAQAASVIDVDRDGDYDVMLAHNGRNRLWLQDGPANGVPTFRLHQEILPTPGSPNDNTRYLRFADLDRDGDLDVCESNFKAPISRVLFNLLN